MLKLGTWEDFVKSIESGKKVACIGTGNRFNEIIKFPKGENVVKNIRYVVDNSIGKQGHICKMGEKQWQIMGPEQLIKTDMDNIIILITIANGYYDVIEQLKALNIRENVDIYCLTHMKAVLDEKSALKKEIPNNIKLSEVMLIPKKIHYCWFGGKPIPDKYKIWMESWKKYCPDYEIIEWNESNYDIRKNEYMYEAYKMKKWGFVPDYARLDIIYNHGGIYLDTDVELVSNIDDLLYQEAFVGFESIDHVNFGSGFGAAKGNPVIKRLRDDYDNIKFEFSEKSTGLEPSPVIQTRLLKKFGLKCDGEYQVLNNMVIYPEKMFCGKSLSSKRIMLKSYTRAIHHYDGSWLDEELRKKISESERDLNTILR